MKLSELDRLTSFALLGPGFSGGEFVLCSPLTPSPHGRVAFVPYEAEGSQCERFDGSVRVVQIERETEPEPLTIVLDDAGHRSGVNAIREAIAAGDVYQVNLTLRAHLKQVSAPALFTVLCRRSVPRFAAWVRFPDGREIVSASPELFFEVSGARIRCEPMKGTASLDAGAQLAVSRKDAAELAMITDLVRNDLTPICVPRSVHVTCERRFVELPYAIQSVSDVEGCLLPGTSIQEILEALHPGGSITGAPKPAARAMIRLLEPELRGAYCGALGYCDGDRATFSLLIRTASRRDRGWVYGVGGGIVWESDPDHELEEARLKLGALL